MAGAINDKQEFPIVGKLFISKEDGTITVLLRTPTPDAAGIDELKHLIGAELKLVSAYTSVDPTEEGQVIVHMTL